MSLVAFTLNGRPVTVDLPPTKRVLDVLRDDFNLTGPKEGCGEGECGACSILLDGMLANACLLPAILLEGRRVVTIEGYRETEGFRVLKRAFEEVGAVQCGFCTPGMILAGAALLAGHPHPTEAQVRGGISGNLCRCTGYNMIVEAVLAAAETGADTWQA